MYLQPKRAQKYRNKESHFLLDLDRPIKDHLMHKLSLDIKFLIW